MDFIGRGFVPVSLGLPSIESGKQPSEWVQIMGKRVVQIKSFANKMPPIAAVKAADKFARFKSEYPQ